MTSADVVGLSSEPAEILPRHGAMANMELTRLLFLLSQGLCSPDAPGSSLMYPITQREPVTGEVEETLIPDKNLTRHAIA